MAPQRFRLRGDPCWPTKTSILRAAVIDPPIIKRPDYRWDSARCRNGWQLPKSINTRTRARLEEPVQGKGLEVDFLREQHHRRRGVVVGIGWKWYPPEKSPPPSPIGIPSFDR
jgi:hypothetical protein